jgi:hypothetical protein
MKMFRMLVALILGLLVITTIGYSGQDSDRSSSLLDRQAKGANLKNVIVGQAAVNALLDAGVPGGVANVSECNESTHSFTPRDSSLRGVLDAIVATDPLYKWEVKEGAINVIPGNKLPTFLAVRMSRFDIVGAASPREVLPQLFKVPEVRRAQAALGRQAVQGGAHAFCPEGCPPNESKKISMSLKNVTVREALNAVAREHGSAVWWFQQSECGGQKWFSLDFAAR